MTRYGIKSMKKIFTLILVLFSFVLLGSQFIEVDAFSGNKMVTITGIFEGSEVFSDSKERPYGSNVSMSTAGLPENQNFAFWIVDNVVMPTLQVDHQFIVTNDLKLEAVFTPAGKVVALFMDVNGKYMHHAYVVAGNSVSTEGVALPYRPGFSAVSSEATRWTKVYGTFTSSINAINDNAVFVQNYTDDQTQGTVNIVVNNGTGSNVTQNFNSVVTAVANTAPEGQKFSHWTENGVTISKQVTYKFSALYNREITAVYVPVAQSLDSEVIVTISKDIERRPGYHTYVGQIEVPAGYTVLEYGFFMGNEAVILTETNNSHVVRATNINALTNEFVSSMSIGSHMSVRAYVVVHDGVEQSIITSEVNHRYLLESIYSINFEDLTGTNPLAYTATTLTTGGITWDTYEAYITSTDANDKKTGEYAVRLRSHHVNGIKAHIQTSAPVSQLASIDLQYAWYSTHTEGRLFISISKDKINWVDVLGNQLPTATLQDVNVVINYKQTEIINAGITSADALYIQIRNENVSGSTNARSLNIDNIKINKIFTGEVLEVNFIDGNEIDTQQLMKSSGLAVSYTPVKTGYTFNGWYDNTEFIGGTYNFSIPVINNLDLFAKWTINQYTIAFNSNDGSEVEAITQDFATSVSAPEAPTKEGYTFAGWFEDVALLNAYTFSTMPAVNTTLYAKWNINAYTISFNSNGGTSVSDITQNFATSVTAPADPTKEGYSFVGWFSDVTLLNAYTFSTMPAVNTTLYAKWLDASSTATVTFDSAGGSLVDSQVVTIGDLATEPTTPTKTGYSFIKWVDGSFDWDFESDTVQEDITLTAVWLINAYTITFNSNGGSAVTPITQDYGTDVVAPTDPTKEGGYNFGGWYSDAGLTTAYTFGTMPAENITVYAKWNEILPIVLRQSDFGETNNTNSNYSNFYIDTVENGSQDPNPSGNSSWSRAGGNYNNTGWDYIAFGNSNIPRKGDLTTSNTTSNTVVDSTDPNFYLATRFALNGVNAITIKLFTLKANTTIYLQTSTDGTNWVDTDNIIQVNAITSETNLSFTNLSNEGNIYYRFILVNATGGSNGSLGRVKSITFYQNP